MIVILALIGAALALLIFNHETGMSFGLPNDDFASLVYLGLLAAVIGAGIVGAHRNLGEMVKNLLIWTVIILGFVSAFLYQDQAKEMVMRIAGGLAPGTPVMISDDRGAAVSIRKSINGHFQAKGLVNGQPVDFLIDTGATAIALSHADAIRIGFSDADLSYTLVISTANGRARAAQVRLDSVDVGSIGRTGLRALVAEPGQLDQSLLGMNFISSLTAFEMRRDEVILRD
ncbi:MAG: TIGR02281 family clan AA aspartic protease [Hoeflea sp.]|uniref:TIGR02281 family clan AA aspartic protease n=1 Tax=Hoeflea sp. TaxID=1940281 RepID=UPI0027322795|nr:TIGR02281 family clan AA aspartic protease [Hoeflea sp.]MDP2122399.1 TIGR02281 family clan AA aspartic protease [Hoeflea sp.]MDP3524063.1 TIGR02281 family clan AA aspartic protease [Hoeflea sp.]MDZ7600115.1 TIGR02281 family clan AA aspartic protease [Hoeflea sp.]